MHPFQAKFEQIWWRFDEVVFSSATSILAKTHSYTYTPMSTTLSNLGQICWNKAWNECITLYLVYSIIYFALLTDFSAQLSPQVKSVILCSVWLSCSIARISASIFFRNIWKVFVGHYDHSHSSEEQQTKWTQWSDFLTWNLDVFSALQVSSPLNMFVPIQWVVRQLKSHLTCLGWTGRRGNEFLFHSQNIAYFW